MTGFSMRQLGKTGLQVSPLGIGGGGGIESRDLLYAFEKGINYYFFSSDLHHFAYRKSAEGLKALCGHKSSVRDKVVLATVSYINHPEKLMGVLIDQLTELGIDYIDVFHWGWVTDNDNMTAIFQAANQLKGDNYVTRMFQQYLISRDHAQKDEEESEFVRMFKKQQEMSEVAQEVNEELVKRGIARYVGASFHSRRAARQWMRNLDVVMLRYNIAHTGVEEDIVPYLSEDKDKDPGIVVFNSAHEGNSYFHHPPKGYPSDLYVPSTPDCYRFALTNPWVDVVLTGLASREHIDEALLALEKGPLSMQECRDLRDYGRICTGKAPVPATRSKSSILVTGWRQSLCY